MRILILIPEYKELNEPHIPVMSWYSVVEIGSCVGKVTRTAALLEQQGD